MLRPGRRLCSSGGRTSRGDHSQPAPLHLPLATLEAHILFGACLTDVHRLVAVPALGDVLLPRARATRRSGSSRLGVQTGAAGPFPSAIPFRPCPALIGALGLRHRRSTAEGGEIVRPRILNLHRGEEQRLSKLTTNSAAPRPADRLQTLDPRRRGLNNARHPAAAPDREAQPHDGQDAEDVSGVGEIEARDPGIVVEDDGVHAQLRDLKRQ